MDLSDVFSVIKRIDGEPPSAPGKSKAEQAFDRLVAHLGTRSVAQSPIKGGFLRASSIERTLEKLPQLADAVSVTEFDAIIHQDAKNPGELWTVDTGSAYHDWFRYEYLGPMQELWGVWECEHCHGTAEGLMPKGCVSCDQPYDVVHRVRFVENYAKDDALRLCGHPDGLIAEPGSGKPTLLLEIKTLGSDGWGRLDGPADEHLAQVHYYMHAVGMRETRFYYIDRGKPAQWAVVEGRLKAVSPPRIKVYDLPFDDAYWERLKAKVAEFWMIRDRLAGTA